MKWYAIKVQDHIRVEKAQGPRTACKQAYGVIYDRPSDTARYKELPKAPKSMSAKAKHELFHSPDGWLRIPGPSSKSD